MLKKLDLSDDQLKVIEPIIKENMDKLRDIQKEARPQIEILVNQMKEKISPLLTDDQKEKWEKLLKYFEEGFRMRRGRGEGRGPGGHGGDPYGPRDGRGSGGGRGPRDGRGPSSGRGSRPEGEGRRPPRPPGPNMPPPPAPGNPQ